MFSLVSHMLMFTHPAIIFELIFVLLPVSVMTIKTWKTWKAVFKYKCLPLFTLVVACFGYLTNELDEVHCWSNRSTSLTSSGECVVCAAVRLHMWKILIFSLLHISYTANNPTDTFMTPRELIRL